MKQAWRMGALVELTKANGRELIRDFGGFFLITLFPFLMIGLAAVMGLSGFGKVYHVVVAVPSAASTEVLQLVTKLEQNPRLQVERLEPTAGQQMIARREIDGLILLPERLDGQINVVVTSQGAIGRLRGWIGETASTIDRERISFRDADGNVTIEGIKQLLPFALFLCFWLLGFYSISFTMILLRQRGTLKLLGLTPLSRLTFICAQALPRLALAMGQLLVILLMAALSGSFALGRLPGIFFSAALGIGMIFGLAYLVGGCFRVPEAGLALPTAVMPVFLFTSGLIVPIEAMPAWVGTISRFNPFTYMADMLKHFLFGLKTTYSPWLSAGIMLMTTLLLILLSVRTFRWDQGEGR